MVAVKVTYTVKPDYVATNQENITKVMDYLNENPIDGMWYKAFLLEDGVSFMHINIARDEATQSKIGEVELFQEFQTQLKASGPVSPPSVENISPVGDSQ